MPHRGRHGVLLVVVLNLAVADGRGPIVDDGQARGAQGLAFTALLQRTDGGVQIRATENIREREHVLDANAGGWGGAS